MKRINMYIDDELYRRLVRLKVRCGFRNIQMLNRAAWRMLIYLYDKQVKAPDDIDDVKRMFDDFSAWEEREFGIVPKRRKKEDVD